MNLNQRLKKAREAIGKSQKDLATALGIGLRSWQGYEDGSNVPGGSVLEGLVRLGFNANWILVEDGPMWLKDQSAHQSSHGTIDREIMETTIRIIEEVFEENDLELPAAKKAKMILLLHDMFVQDEQKLKAAKNTIIELVKLAS